MNLKWNKENASDFFLLIFLIGIIAVYGYYLVTYAEGEIRYYMFNTNYDLGVLAVVIFGLLVVAFRRYFPNKWYKVKTTLFFLILFPVAMLPLFRCYFSIPFVFCRVCPNPCVFGATRLYNFSGFFLMNLRGRHFCYHMCPFGTLQDVANKLIPKKVKIPAIFKHIRWVFLVFVVVMVSMTHWFLPYLDLKPNFWYAPSMIVIASLFVFLMLSYFIYRPFCEYVCPVGSTGDIVLWVKKKLGRKK